MQPPNIQHESGATESDHSIHYNVLPDSLLMYMWGQDIKNIQIKRKTSIDNLEARTVSEEGLRALRVVKRSMANTTPRSADGEVAAVIQVARAVAVLGCFIDYLERDTYFLH